MFANSERMSRFLRHIVERTCAGQADQLKEFAIGTDVFDRDERYDPRLDSVVRVEASRLRSKLAEYYASEGVDDAVLITVPKGGYIPAFGHRAAAVAAGGAERPAVAPEKRTATNQRPWFARIAAAIVTVAVAAGAMAWYRGNDVMPRRALHDLSIAVLPFEVSPSDKSGQALAAQVTDGVTRELTRLGSLQVVSHLTARHAATQDRSLSDIARAVGADVVATGNLLYTGDGIRVEAVLVDATSDRKFWVGEIDGVAANLGALQQQVAASLAKAVADNSRGAYWTHRP